MYFDSLGGCLSCMFSIGKPLANERFVRDENSDRTTCFRVMKGKLLFKLACHDLVLTPLELFSYF